MHVAIRKREEMAMDPDTKAQIEAQKGAQGGAQSKAQVGTLIFNKAPTKVLAEYSNYSKVFSTENATEHPKHTRMNDYAIKLKNGKQPLFGPIYSLEPVELETLKTYIDTNLANSFIWPSKSPAGALILFNRKPNRSFCLFVDYWGLNNITIKNRYPLPLIGESLDGLDRAKQFT